MDVSPQGSEASERVHIEGSFFASALERADELGTGSIADVALFKAAIQEEAERQAEEDVFSTRKLAFLFMTPDTLPLAQLWCQFFRGHEGLFSIHVHKFSPIALSGDNLTSCFEGAWMPREGSLGSSDFENSMEKVDGLRRLLARALLDPDNARFITISQSTIPIYNFFFIYNYLMGTPHSFVKGVFLEGSGGTRRWHKGFLPAIQRNEWKKGSPWMALNRHTALLIVRDVEHYKMFKSQCSWTPHRCCCQDEHYFATLLHKLEPGRLVNRTLTWSEWSQKTKSKVAFGKASARPHMVDLVRSSPSCTWGDNERAACFLFAMEMKPDALQPLLTLSSAMGY